MNKLFLLVIVFLTACGLGGSALEGTYENVGHPGFGGRLSLTIHPDKTITMVNLDKGRNEVEKTPYNVTNKTLQIQGLPWTLTIYDDGSLDGSTMFGVFKKI